MAVTTGIVKDEQGNHTGEFLVRFDDGTEINTGIGRDGVLNMEAIKRETGGDVSRLSESATYKAIVASNNRSDEEKIAALADLTYLSQNTGVDSNKLKQAYKDVGIEDWNDSFAYVEAQNLLKENGYNPGDNKEFYGNNSAVDVGAQILADRWNNAPTDDELIEAGLNPDDFVVVNNNVANQTYLRNKLTEMGGGYTNANFGNLNEGQTIEQNRLDFDKQLEGTTNQFWGKFESPSTAALDMLEWDLIKKTGVDKTGYEVNQPTANITGGTSSIPSGGQITGGATGSTYPTYSSTPSIGNVTPIYGGEQTGLTEYTIPTYECCLGQQATDFAKRATCQATFYQPQTQAEKEATGNAPAFENVMYRNRFGMTTYIQHINGVPSQPIPPGYYKVESFTDQSQTQAGSAAQGGNQGGMIQSFSNGGLPEGVTIQKYGDRYGYADPFGNRIDVRDAQGNIVTYQNPEYALTGASNNPDVTSALSPYNPYTGDINPALNYQPGGSIVQSDGGFRIQYPGEGGPTSQLFSTYGQAVAANQAGLSGLGLPDYQGYLSQQGINPEAPGYDPAAYQAAYQGYITDPATLEALQSAQSSQGDQSGQGGQGGASETGTPQSATVNQDFLSGQQTVTKEDLAQYQRNLAAQAYAAPGGAVAAPPVSYIDPNAYGSVVESTAGQAQATAPMVTEDQVAQITSATTADTPQKIGAGQVTSQAAFSDIQNATDAMTAAQMTGGPSKQIDAAQQTGTSLSGLTSQTADSINVAGAPTRTEQTGEMISGTGVDQAQVGQAFGTGEVQAASVQGELANLMSQFEGGETPAWAAGSMRAASQLLAARGLGASSMAGQAVIQAAMEAALPIAQIDASNKQQMALFKAEQRAKFLQMDFDQAFQAKVMNAAKVSEIANMNFTAEQQIALENSKAANTMQLQNLSNKQALVMAEAAALSQMDMANLNNRQQAAVQNAQNFLQVDMANLSNEQQTALFKQQALINSILSDQAAANAAQQFNATSENQTNQFFANLGASVNQFNAAQINAMKQFNADEVNSLLEFNASIQNQREMFNAQNYLVVAQANAQWRQNLATINTAAANESNMDYAQTVNGLTVKALDEIWQRERDLMDYSFTSSENAADRALSMLLGDKQLQAIREQIESEEDTALGGLLTKVFFSSDFKSIFDPT